MIEIVKGDLLRQDADALVNTVNCVGVMGRGIALQFKKAYSENFKAYYKACKLGEVQPGKMVVFQTGNLTNPKYIINFPTKRHWREKSKMQDITDGLKDLVAVIKKRSITSVAIPPLGSGLGGLLWGDVKKEILSNLTNLDNCHVFLFEPVGAPPAQEIVRNKKSPNMTSGRAALIGLMSDYLEGLLDPFITLLELHKLMYFMQEAGEALKLKYRKAQFGPYAENLRHVLHHIEGFYVSGYADGGDNPNKAIELAPGATRDAEEFLKKHPRTLKNFEKVSKLVDGFESSFGLELLSTVHWVVKKENATSLEQVFSKAHSWNQKKKKFDRRHIEIAYKTLQENGWLENP